MPGSCSRRRIRRRNAVPSALVCNYEVKAIAWRINGGRREADRTKGEAAMRILVAMSFCVYLLTGGGASLQADEKQRHEDLIRSVVEGWRARQDQVQTLTCSASIDSFYPKGLLSDMASPKQRAKQTHPLPEEDKTFSNQPFTWAIDFKAQRVKMERESTEPYPAGGVFFIERELQLFADGKYRLFQPKDGYPHTEPNYNAFQPEVVLYENVSHSFLFSFPDLPLLWTAGGVSGKFPRPEDMQFCESPEHYSWRGEADWGGHKCVVLTVQEQESNTGVREFWAAPKAPYQIYYCRSRDGDQVDWQLEVEYNEQNPRCPPRKWTYTEYHHPGQSFERMTYSVQNIEFNAPLAAELFHKKLEPGQTALDAETNKKLEVDANGSLTPLNQAGKPTNALLIIFLNVIALALLGVAGFFAWRYYRRRSSRA